MKRSSVVVGAVGWDLLLVSSGTSSAAAASAAAAAKASMKGSGVGSLTYILLVINLVRCCCRCGRTLDEPAKNDQKSSAC